MFFIEPNCYEADLWEIMVYDTVIANYFYCTFLTHTHTPYDERLEIVRQMP